jgi:hypothetical protein
MASILGAILKGKKVGQDMLRAYRIKHGKRGKTITGVKPMSGKTPWFVSAGGKNPGKRAKIVKTHFSNLRSDKVEKAEKSIKEGKEKLKKLVDTGQAEKIGERHFRKGFDR